MKNFSIKISLMLFLVLCLVFSLKSTVYAAKASGPTIVQYQATDGFNITGLLDLPSGSSIKKKVPLVIFLHSLGGSKIEWGTFPNSVKSLGFATLNIDLRGHGQSILDKRNKKKYWPNFNKTDFSKYPSDVSLAINYLKENYPEINTGKIAIIGSDIGADTAILAGYRFNKNVKTLILLSPTTFYKGLDTRVPLVGYGVHPVLIIVSQSDRFSYNDSTELIKYAQGKKVLKAYPYGGSGIDLLKFQPDSKGLILNWLKTNLI